MSKKNLMIIGASGGVANALLHHLVHHRNFFGKLILVDKNKKLLSDPYIDHKSLNYIFVHEKIEPEIKEKEYHALLKKYKVNIVLDITNDNSLPFFYSTNKAGVSYVNTGLNGPDSTTIYGLIFEVWKKRSAIKNAPHILCTGMNPGAVNMWARHCVEEHGKPKEIILFEYDTSKVANEWRPAVTWSVKEFLSEVVEDCSAIMLGRNNVKEFYPNSLEHRRNMRDLLAPVMKFDKYPDGFTVPHEETTSLAQKYNIPTKYIYAINMKTMETLVRLYEKNKKVTHEDLILGDNTNKILDGADNIGMLLEYKDKKVYYFNSIPNISAIGTNATYTQVVLGIMAALFTLIFDKMKPGTYFVEDLYENHYKYYLFDNMRVSEFVFKKEKNELKLVKYRPEIKIKRMNHFQHLYI